MSEPEPMPWFGGLFFIAFFCIWFWHVYLMLARPRTWVEWFLAKLYRPFGIAVSIVDEQKLRSKLRLMGIPFLLGGLFFVIVIIWAGVRSGK